MELSTQQELDRCYMNVATEFSKLSKAQRNKVGAVILTKQGIIIPGTNGMPSGMSNECEEKVWIEDYNSFGDMGEYKLVTKQACIHAERNCIIKAAREGVSILDGTLYVTTSCCEQCAAMIIQSGISRVVYDEEYRLTEGLQLLKDANILVEKFKF